MKERTNKPERDKPARSPASDVGQNDSPANSRQFENEAVESASGENGLAAKQPAESGRVQRGRAESGQAQSGRAQSGQAETPPAVSGPGNQSGRPKSAGHRPPKPGQSHGKRINHKRANRNRDAADPASRADSQTSAADLQPGDTEIEFGVPLAGIIQPPDRWAKTAIKRLPEPHRLDFVQLFERDAPRVLDIGCGNGRFLIASAVRRPEVDHIGIDALPMVIRYATRRANMRGLTNCRLAVCDGERFLRDYGCGGQLNEIHVYHPQPYHDRREHHLRLFQHSFLWLIHQSLASQGRLVVQTDNRAYWEYLQRVLPAITDWHEQTGPWADDPQGRSRREIVAIRKGLRVYRGWGTRRGDIDQTAFQHLCESLPEPDFDSQHNRNPNRWRRR